MNHVEKGLVMLLHLRSCTRRSVSHWLCPHRCCTGVWSCWADDLADSVPTWSHWNCSSNPSDQWWRTAVANWNPIQTYHHQMIFVGDSISWVNVSRTLDWWGCFLLLQSQGWSQPSMWLYRVSCRSATEVLGWTWSICLIRKTLNSITKYLITTNQLLPSPIAMSAEKGKPLSLLRFREYSLGYTPTHLLNLYFSGKY